MKLKTVVVQVTPNQKKRMETVKERNGCSLSSQIRLALDEYWGRKDATG